MHSRRPLIENIASLGVLQLLSYAAPLVTVPYLVRKLQPAQFGALSFAQGVVLYLAMFTDFGFNVSSTKDIAINRSSPQQIARIFWSTCFAKLVLLITSAAALGFGLRFVPILRETPSLFLASFLYVLGTVAFPIWLFQGLECVKPAVVAFGTARLLSVPALFLLVRGPNDCVTAAGIQASVEVVAGLFVAPVIWRKLHIGWYQPSISDLGGAFRRAWPLFISSCALFVATSSTTVILGIFATKSAVGYYSAADKLIKAAVAALNPLSQALYPHISAARAKSDHIALQLIRKSFVCAMAFSGVVSIVTFAFALPVCRLVFGTSFDPAGSLLRVLSPLPILFGFVAVLGTQTMVVFEMDAAMGRILLGSAVVGIPLTALAAFLFGARGAAASYVLVILFMVIRMFATLHVSGLAVWRSKRAATRTVSSAPEIC